MNRAPPAVIVRSARDVAAVVAHNRPATLLSAPGAAAFAGSLWWAALVRFARTTAPGVVALDILDAADAPGTALGAFRCGCRTVALARSCAAWPAVDSVAREIGATLLDAVPPALDLGQRGASRHLAAWLAGDTATGVG